MNRWGMRIVLIVMLLGFALVFSMMYRQLVAMQQLQQEQSQPAPSR
ncbi:MAG: hypothetical protein JO197_03965 [Acidobacteria bacterium]|nr:hypothetical protein [Acidobacteriota bacterium]MBV9476458.1 hypothetical protein [Acidobacteriota bacterium]